MLHGIQDHHLSKSQPREYLQVFRKNEKNEMKTPQTFG